MIDLKKYLVEKHGGHKSGQLNSPDEIALPECFWCHKDKDHFNFNIKTNKGGCLKCGKGFHSVVQMICKLEHLNETRAKLYLMHGSLEERSKMSLVKDILGKNKIDEKTESEIEHLNTELPDEFIPMVDLTITGVKIRIPLEFKERNYSRKIISKAKIGYCGEGDYACRIIFPIYCKDMKSFVARRIHEWQNKKYKNPPGSKHSQLLYNYNNMPEYGGLIFVVEGVTDVLRLWSYGLYAVCTFGKKISFKQIDLLVELQPKEVVSVFDGDAVKQNKKSFEKLSLRLNASYMVLPKKNDEEYYDPDDLPKEKFFKAFEKRIGLSKLDNAIRILKSF